MSISCSHFISNSFFYFQFELQFELFPQILLRKPFVCAFSYQCKQATTKKQKNSKGPEGAWGPPLGHSVFNRCPLATFQSTIGKKNSWKKFDPCFGNSKEILKMEFPLGFGQCFGYSGVKQLQKSKIFLKSDRTVEQNNKVFLLQGKWKIRKIRKFAKSEGIEKIGNPDSENQKHMHQVFQAFEPTT